MSFASCFRSKTSDDVYRNVKLEETISQCQSKGSIRLSEMNLTDQDMPLIIRRAVCKKKCAELFLEHNTFTSDAVKILVKELKINTRLTELNLSGNPLGDEAIEYLTQFLANALQNQVLIRLWLRQANITNRGVYMFANALQTNRTLEELYLEGYNLITDDCVSSVIKMLRRNKTLREFNLEACSLSNKGIERLGQPIKDKIQFESIFTKQFYRGKKSLSDHISECEDEDA